MNSMAEQAPERDGAPSTPSRSTYAPKRVRWPGFVAVAVIFGVVMAGIVLTSRDDGAHPSGSPDRSADVAPPVPRTDWSTAAQPDDSQVATPAKPAQQ
ncbi:MAG TPA: hypothetical protein VI032_18730 [Burkholderiaceae bacterium]